MTDEEINAEIDFHIKKMKELDVTCQLLKKIIKANNIIIKWCNQFEINYLWIEYVLFNIEKEFFIITPEQFHSYINQPKHGEFLKKLWNILISLKFFRPIKKNTNKDEFLISESFRSYVDLCNSYVLDSLEYFEKYSIIDSMDVDEALDYYHSYHLNDPMWASKSYCDYYGYEHNDSFYIIKENE